jgi:TatD DNase family protein
MPMQLIDTHSHLTDSAFDSDRDAVLERAEASGVIAMVAVGTTAESSGRAIELAGHRARVHAAVGIHPNYAAEAGVDDWERIVQLACAARVVAIGETGLDRFRSDTPFDVQLDYFERHLALARERRLPVIIHSRDADSDVVEALERFAVAGPVAAVMHSFTGTAATAARCIELGCYISFAGQLTFTNRKFDSLREVARVVPPDRLLVETDSPYLAPEPYRGKRNEPAHVRWTAEKLAELRGQDIKELAALTSDNARRLFDRIT